MLHSLRSIVGRWLSGERRHRSRPSAERVQVVNRQYAAAVKLSRRLGRPPEELLDYHIADRVLSRKGH